MRCIVPCGAATGGIGGAVPPAPGSREGPCPVWDDIVFSFHKGVASWPNSNNRDTRGKTASSCLKVFHRDAKKHASAFFHAFSPKHHDM